MADFCKQCSIENFDSDMGDLKGLCQEDYIVEVLCEGCGPVYVNHEGKCVGDRGFTCLKKHEEE
jgi:hypothetical protein